MSLARSKKAWCTLNVHLAFSRIFQFQISSKARVNCEKKADNCDTDTRPGVHKQPPPPPFAHHFHHHHAATTTTNSQPLYETPIYPEMGSGGGPGGIPGSYQDSSGASHQVKREATNFYLLKILMDSFGSLSPLSPFRLAGILSLMFMEDGRDKKTSF